MPGRIGVSSFSRSHGPKFISSSCFVSSGSGPNYLCNAQALTRLSNNAGTLTGKINQMKADGGTNLVEGFMWGWRTLTPHAPFADGKAYTERR